MKKQLANIANSDFARLAYSDGPIQRAMATAEHGRLIDEYCAKAFRLTDEQLDQLILQFSSGGNSFADLARVVPALNSPTLLAYLADAPPLPEDAPLATFSFRLGHTNQLYFKMEPTPSRFGIPYDFRPTDRFVLTIDGLNRLYVLKKEAHLLELAERSADAAVLSRRYARIAVLLTAIGLMAPVLGFLLSSTGISR